MTNELKPCPFCGSEAKLFTARGKCNQIVRCVACNVSPGYRQTKKEAIEAWNRRAESTCRDCIIAAIPNGETPNGQALVLERTCEDQLYGRDPCVFVCSLCEHITDHAEDERPNYCPHCGAKVVVEE